jgi:hypothetical protein
MGYMTNRQALGGITDVATAALRVVEDPCLYQVTDLVLKLHELEQRPSIFKPPSTRPPGPPPPPPPPVKGIGLCTAVTPLKIVVYVKSRPWILPLALAAVVGGLVGTGYLIGSSSSRARAPRGGGKP